METVYGHRRRRSWSKVTHGVYVRGSSPTLVDELRGWSLVLPARAAFTHLTAAELCGWWLPGPIPHPVFAVTRRGGQFPQRAGLSVSRTVDWPEAQVVARGPGRAAGRGSPGLRS